MAHYCTHVSSEEGYAGNAEREKYFPGIGKRDKRWNGSGSTSSGGSKAALKTSESSNKPAAKAPTKRVSKVSKPAASAANGSSTQANARSAKEVEDLKALVAEKEEVAQDLQLNVDALEKERDFYFGKLRDIEILCQEKEAYELDENIAGLIDTIKKIMYATDDADDEEAAADQVENDESY